MKESNDLVRRRKDEARRTRAGERRREGDSSKTGRVTFISGPTVRFPNTGFGDEVKGESRTGHIKVFLVGRAPLIEVSFFLPGFDVKGSRSCFDGVVFCAVFNIHAVDRERREERSGEEIFGQTES